MEGLPLKGIRVADFGWVLAVPHATAWLAMLGADVVRVESAARLDIVRAGGMRTGADGIPGLNRAAMYNGLNYSKRGITLNLADPRGVELAKELVKVSDVVTENFAAGVFEKFGLGYDVLRAIKPDIIMLTGSPLGQTGPDRNATGWGPNTQAYAGLPHITGYEGAGPSGIGGLYPDYMIGVSMAFALLAAIHHRQRTGEGQLVEVAMAEVVASMIPEAVVEYSMNRTERPRMGNADQHMAPHGVYRCAGEDRWVAIAVEDDARWQAFKAVLGNPAWAQDPALDRAAGRLAARTTLDREIGAWTVDKTPYEVMHLLEAHGIAAGPSLDVVELMDDPQVLDRGIFVEMDHPEIGPKKMVGIPGRYSALEWDMRHAPLLGEHNEEVYKGLLGLSDAEYDRFVAEKVIY